MNGVNVCNAKQKEVTALIKSSAQCLRNDLKSRTNLTKILLIKNVLVMILSQLIAYKSLKTEASA